MALNAAVAGVLQHQRESRSYEDAEFDLNRVLENPNVFRNRIETIDSVLHDVESQTLFCPPKESSEKQKESKLQAFLEQVQSRIDRSTRYRKLAGTSLFFLLFILLVFVQRDSQTLFAIESSLLDFLIGDLPTYLSGGFMNSGVGATGYIRNNDDLYSWLQQSILPSVFQDPVCGDGVCDSPAEYPGFGRFGCIPDCGKYPNLTSVSLSLKDVIADSGALLGWDLTLLDSSLDPSRSKFTYNIYSDTMNAFVFEQDIDNATLSLELPDGQYTLVMYQTKQTTDLVDLSTIEHYLRLVQSTVPPNQQLNSFDYGDTRELIASVTLMIENIIDYCSKLVNQSPDSKCETLDVTAYEKQLPLSFAETESSFKQAAMSCPSARDKQSKGSHLKNNINTKLRSTPNISMGTKQVGDTCSSHADCAASSFCAAWTVVASSSSSSSTFVCKPCALCTVDTRDSYDGVCPQDKCPGSGGFPPCVNASALLASFSSSCENHNHFDIWSYGSSSSGPPVVIPPFTPKVLEVTPFNRMVGALVVSQKRMQSLPTCVDHIQDPGLHNYTLLAQSSINCPSTSAQESTPFGFDPTFMPSSSLYNGELRADRFYGDSERHSFVDDSGQEVISYPYGFFPHRYDSNHLDLNMDGELTPDELARDVNGSDFSKSPAVVVSLEADNFKVYFDERLSRKQALDMLTSLQDGKFIDFQTKQVSVELMTYNAVRNILSYCQVTFTWDVGGKIPWEYKITTVGVDKIKHPSTWQLLLMLAILLALVINVGMEVTDILHHLRKFSASSYFTDPFNLIDWLHFAFLVGSVVSWLLLHSKARAFSLKVGYPILFYGPEYGSSRRVSSASSQGSAANFESPIAVTSFAKARRLRTNNQAEYDFLLLLDSVKAMASAEDMYAFFAGMSIVLFVFRMLKSLDFQERMGMVTRTIGRASSDLFHFLLLFMIVFVGYAIVGVFLFGHQYEGMSNLSGSFKSLAITILNMDTTQFYTSMDHAASDISFQLYLWSYIFVVLFILFNIFLAILVEAYSNVKQSTDARAGLVSELKDVLSHGARRWLPGSRNFMADQKIRQSLQDELKARGSSQRMKEVVDKEMARRKAILLRGGVQIDEDGLLDLLTMQSSSSASVAPAPEDAGEGEGQRRVMLDILERYGKDVSELRERRNRELREIVGMENMKRLLAMNLMQINVLEDQRRTLDLVESIASSIMDSIPERRKSFFAAASSSHPESSKIGKLSVCVHGASGLPKMDLIRSCDPYCILYLTGQEDAQSYVTRTIPRSVTPKWEEEFEWDVAAEASSVVITVWDKDNITKDDFIGSVSVELSKALYQSSHENIFLPILNPKIEGRLKQAKLELSVRFHLYGSC
ncbi:hypothetical protein GUITHDRAFT_121487 [Guillardia theta CCMP2712]|uniref:C2 domain-containing protein n=1 Tax=Guillardia theta (strain CCMP2712) TaxID=905079 RepID=L1I7W9_GUITC|nr:hypothetical protein GUITHDRAFT_121487 [Guillardia theta CCMP2712]EKX32346.1 hypothetical protein GUITHDRAFT_121487 [Guillardia theta CCMP2712]|eukprot:XP_005819326.1 hypothetical protein GUITHDRAFT_121487 [Guillardia theta CCMP2712]